MGLTDGHAKLSNGAEIDYRDTGSPGTQNYRTFILVHGVASNKRNF
jgi:hypothetical protein